MRIDGYEIRLKSEAVGPRHDPYQRDTIIVERDGRKATWTTCGLAGDVVKLYESGPDGYFQTKEMSLGFSGNERYLKQKRLKMRILFRRHVGIAADYAEDKLNREHYRLDREARKADEPTMDEIRAMERAAGWDANP
jgi:hypothetical protein